MYYLLKYILLGPLMRVVFRPDVEGRENVPATGPVIIACSHGAFIDSLFLPLVVPRRMAFLAKAEYFTGTGFRGWLQRRFFNSVGQVPIDRAGGKRSEAALNAGLRVLGEGRVLGIYPEGTRTLDGRLHRGRTGAARMALASGVPIIPATVIGTFEAQPKGRTMPKPTKITIKFGKPINIASYAQRGDDPAVLRELTDELMWRIQRLSGQEYVDLYVQDAEQLKGSPRMPTKEQLAALQDRSRAGLQELTGSLSTLPERLQGIPAKLPGLPPRGAASRPSESAHSSARASESEGAEQHEG